MFNSIKREQRYYEFKLDVYKQTGDRQETDLVLEVTPPEVGHLKTGNCAVAMYVFTRTVLCNIS